MFKLFGRRMAEAPNSILKHRYLCRKNIQTIGQLEEEVKFLQDDFGNRPHGSLYGTTPYEAVRQEQTPDKNRYKVQITKARKIRIAENQKIDCAKCLTASLMPDKEVEHSEVIK